MSNAAKVKKQLLDKCFESVQGRISDLDEALRTVNEAKSAETKSSVGDKYETGRALLQNEEARLRQQMQNAKNELAVLSQITLDRDTSIIGIGSLVTTNTGSYFISIGIGKVFVENKTYYCISKGSPIAQIMIGLQQDAEFTFNNKLFRIRDVC